jgi:hypothetical protein
MQAELARLRGGADGSFTFHGIASPDSPGPCPGAADVGGQYIDLASTTGGLFLSICTESWDGLFDELGARIEETTPIPCSMALPSAPEGVMIDLGAVNIQYTSGGMAPPEVIPSAGEPSACGVAGGWFYDNRSAPREIVLCPSTCERVRATLDAELEIQLGCETILI